MAGRAGGVLHDGMGGAERREGQVRGRRRRLGRQVQGLHLRLASARLHLFRAFLPHGKHGRGRSSPRSPLVRDVHPPALQHSDTRGDFLADECQAGGPKDDRDPLEKRRQRCHPAGWCEGAGSDAGRPGAGLLPGKARVHQAGDPARAAFDAALPLRGEPAVQASGRTGEDHQDHPTTHRDDSAHRHRQVRHSDGRPASQGNGRPHPLGQSR
mmetsp:Transcript_82608/g.215610  ORF Transcript_82608/g.215610 Transcript_82608/m.215610 type:complete len:212 (+) Transcript_82608:178-813(+)